MEREAKERGEKENVNENDSKTANKLSNAKSTFSVSHTMDRHWHVRDGAEVWRSCLRHQQISAQFATLLNPCSG